MIENLANYLKVKAGIDERQFAEVAGRLRAESIRKGEFLLQQGGVCSSIFFLSNGLLRSYLLDEAGKEHIIQFAPENWLITDRASLFFNTGSELYIDAIEDSQIVFLDRQVIDRLSDLSPDFRRFNGISLNKHIRSLQHRIGMLLGYNAEARYLDFIETYPQIPLRVPQWMIASYLGITPESLSRVRKELAVKNFRPPGA